MRGVAVCKFSRMRKLAKAMPCSAYLSDLGKPQEWRSHAECRQAACVNLLESAHFCVSGETTRSTPLQNNTRKNEYLRFANASQPMVTHKRPSLAFCAIKRTFDVVSASVGLVLLSPLLLGTAIAVKAISPGPVIFKQERYGRNKQPFTCCKFRSMTIDTPSDVPTRVMGEKQSVITPIGATLRKTSIDELPQLANIVKGDMTTVGPRPALPAEVATYSDYQRQRLLVKPGMTCYWQTRRNRDSITFDEWVDLDLLYIKKCGPWTDFKLVIQTIGVVLTVQGS